jgi:hypothetical protein
MGHFPEYAQVWPSESAGQQHHSSVPGKFVIESFALGLDGISHRTASGVAADAGANKSFFFISSLGREEKT